MNYKKYANTFWGLVALYLIFIGAIVFLAITN